MKLYGVEGLEIQGPYNESSAPWGRVVPSLNRQNYFVDLNGKTIGVIVRFDNQPKRFIIDQLYPNVDRTTLKAAVLYLVKNNGKLCFCT